MSAALIRDRKQVADDYVSLDAEATLPASGKIILPLARWQQDQAALAGNAALQVGVRIPNTADIMQIWPLLKDHPLVVLEFPSFADGRAYSQATLLRSRLGFGGEIRATGAAVVLDQLAGMQRCGINSFELRADQDAALCLKVLGAWDMAYQPATDSLKVVPELRTH